MKDKKNASGGQGLFLKKPPLDPAKTFDSRSVIVLCFIRVFPIGIIYFLLFFVFLRVLRAFVVNKGVLK
jgi:Ni,Fe-hydrogenase I cytochrome b subunit